MSNVLNHCYLLHWTVLVVLHFVIRVEVKELVAHVLCWFASLGGLRPDSTSLAVGPEFYDVFLIL